ncbi:hypothetical protein [Jannaschia sp. M317]|uniref:hypothetical protein n=1 Tax=Jannaschia sp. M317 TaxID=2867011 RepID=UPI0021A6EB65|nr:hypothetical protein [Jannaschia sp. M317]UWQ19681.1 hypothetical protein K3551_18190 [Jannaschia sp. M317]
MVDLTFPPEEAAFVERHYTAAEVILEYGSGGSTLLAARLPDKRIFTVENDRSWALDIQRALDAEATLSPVTLYPVYIGPTGKWGRPVDTRQWHLFHRYPMAIWDEAFFRHPDLVLIDGRFRPACFAAVCLRAQAPITVLFDDYAERIKYHVIEQILKPVELVGRMARFEVEPGLVTPEHSNLLVSLFAETTYSRRTPNYEIPFNPKRG